MLLTNWNGLVVINFNMNGVLNNPIKLYIIFMVGLKDLNSVILRSQYLWKRRDQKIGGQLYK